MKSTKRILSILTGFCLLGWNTSNADDLGKEIHNGHSAETITSHTKPSDDKVQTGPNGGRIITSVEPHFEFFLTNDRFIQITFLNERGDVVAPEGQVVSLVGGDRQKPIRLRFNSKGPLLVSDKAVPEGANLPIILSIKNSPDAPTIRERFNLNLSECPTCNYREYACICEH